MWQFQPGLAARVGGPAVEATRESTQLGDGEVGGYMVPAMGRLRALSPAAEEDEPSPQMAGGPVREACSGLQPPTVVGSRGEKEGPDS